MWGRLKGWARSVKREVLTVYLLARDPRLAWPLRLLALGVAAYALSPIDLIPDAIPVLGFLDDLLLVPAGLYLVLRLAPAELTAEHRRRAEGMAARPVSRWAAAAVIAIWLATAAGALLWLIRARS